MTWFDFVPAAVVSLAVLIDIRWRQIPNWLTFSALLVGVVLHVMRAGAAGLGSALGGAALGLGLLLPFYVLRGLGAGDVKLLAGLGALVGPASLVSVALYGAVVGGVMSIVILVQSHQLGRFMRELAHNPTRPRLSGARAPYSVAIASGVYLSMLLPRVIG